MRSLVLQASKRENPGVATPRDATPNRFACYSLGIARPRRLRRRSLTRVICLARERVERPAAAFRPGKVRRSSCGPSDTSTINEPNQSTSFHGKLLRCLRIEASRQLLPLHSGVKAAVKVLKKACKFPSDRPCVFIYQVTRNPAPTMRPV